LDAITACPAMAGMRRFEIRWRARARAGDDHIPII
jgi:hypothetical protein